MFIWWYLFAPSPRDKHLNMKIDQWKYYKKVPGKCSYFTNKLQVWQQPSLLLRKLSKSVVACRTQGLRRLPHKSMKDLSNWEICSLWSRLTQCSLGLYKVIFTFEKEKTRCHPHFWVNSVWRADKFPVRCLDMKVPIGNPIVSKSRDNFHFLKEMNVKSGKPKWTHVGKTKSP